MSRSIWFVAGAGAGVYAVTRARRVAETFTSEGLRDRLGALAVGARLFRDEVRAGRHDSETQLRERMGLVPHGIPELGSGLDTLAGARYSTTEGAEGARYSTTDEVARHQTTEEPEGITRGHR